jgi:hypothetical protein
MSDMKYLLLIHNNPAALAALEQAERDAIFGDVDRIMADLTASGELVGGQALADASQTKTVRTVDGALTATDGPFAESKEQLAGYLIVECETIERATEIAASWPDAKFGAMEVRPIMHTTGLEM